MWEKVASRHHKPLKVFPYGSKADEVMLFGTVDYGLKDGRKASVEWAARAHLIKKNDTVKMDFYQVYLVCHVVVYAGTEWQLADPETRRTPLHKMRQNSFSYRLRYMLGLHDA